MFDYKHYLHRQEIKMNQKQLISQIQSNRKDDKDEEYEVVIEASRFLSVAGTSIVKLRAVRQGFDWDNGRIILVPSEKLAVMDEDTQIGQRFWQEVVEAYWWHTKNNTIKQFGRSLRGIFDDTFKKSHWPEKIKKYKIQAKNKQLKTKN